MLVEQPPELQGVLIIVDTVVAYTWMGFLISFAARQEAFDLMVERSISRKVHGGLQKDKQFIQGFIADSYITDLLTREGIAFEVITPSLRVAVLFGAACVGFGIFPSVLFDFAAHAGRALGLT